MAVGRVFIVESPNPLDLLEGRSERLSLEQVCKLVGHNPATFLVRDLAELKQTFGYISSIEVEQSDEAPLFIHISSHGNKKQLAFGPDSVSWDELARIVQDMYAQLCFYRGPIIVILSACGANKQTMTAALAKRVIAATTSFVPPEYVFVSSQDVVKWSDAVVTWTIFYQQVKKVNFEKRATVQNLLNRIYSSGFGDLSYYRWDDSAKRYKHFQPEKHKN